MLPFNLHDAGKDIGGTLVKASDKRILVSVEGLTITPTTTDHVVTADGVYTIVKNSTLAPAGIPIIHDIVGSQRPPALLVLSSLRFTAALRRRLGTCLATEPHLFCQRRSSSGIVGSDHRIVGR